MHFYCEIFIYFFPKDLRMYHPSLFSLHLLKLLFCSHAKWDFSLCH